MILNNQLKFIQLILIFLIIDNISAFHIEVNNELMTSPQKSEETINNYMLRDYKSVYIVNMKDILPLSSGYSVVYHTDINKEFNVNIYNELLSSPQKEEESFKYELNKILDWVDELQKVNTENIEPMLSVFNESMTIREDSVESTNSQEILNNAPEKKEDFFVVPKVIE